MPQRPRGRLTSPLLSADPASDMKRPPVLRRARMIADLCKRPVLGWHLWRIAGHIPVHPHVAADPPSPRTRSGRLGISPAERASRRFARPAVGFPVSGTSSVMGGRVQRFQHGAIYHRQRDRDPVAVPAETIELAGDRLGWPVSPEESIGASDDRVQCFENGSVTRRSGKLEMWLRPAPAAAPPA